MDKKAIIKKILFIVLVPTVIVGTYYGYHFAKKKYDSLKLKKSNDGN